MPRFSLPMIVALLVSETSTVQADPPVLSNITPLGVERGKATEITFNGANLAANPQIVAGVPITVEAVEKPGDAANYKLKVTVPNEVALGAYPIRIKTDGGISGPILLSVDQLAPVSEVEPNNTFDAPQSVSIPTILEGQAGGSDVDFFRFAGRKGQKLLIDAKCARIGSGVDPQFSLSTAGHKFVGSADDTAGIDTDARMVVELPEDGEYVLELSDSKYQGGARPVYRVTVGTLPTADEVYPLGGRRGETVGLELRGGSVSDTEPSVAAARLSASADAEMFRARITDRAIGLAGPTDPTFEVELPGALELSDYPEVREASDPSAGAVKAVAPVVFNGRIEAPGDVDQFRLVVTPGEKLRIEVRAAALGSAMDGVLRVLKTDNSQLATADDTSASGKGKGKKGQGVPRISPDPSLDFTVPADQHEIVLEVKDLEGRGGLGYPYRIVVEPTKPGLSPSMAGDPQVNVPKGGWVVVPVSLARQDFNGPVTLEVLNPPAGLVVRPGKVTDGQPGGVLSLSSAADAAFGAVSLDVVAKADGPAGPIVEKAYKEVVFAQQANMTIYSEVQVGLYAAASDAQKIALDAPGEPITAVHGYPATVPVKITRGEGAEGALSITPLPPPPAGIAIPEAKADDKAAEAKVVVNVAPEAPLGLTSVGLIAKGKIEKKDQTFVPPVVTLNVVRPAALELSAPNLQVKAGTTVEFKGKVVRQEPFKQAVKVQINGLPAGLTAAPVDLPADGSEFTLKVVATAEAAAADASAQAVMLFKLGDKDYNTPPTALAVKVVK